MPSRWQNWAGSDGVWAGHPSLITRRTGSGRLGWHSTADRHRGGERPTATCLVTRCLPARCRAPIGSAATTVTKESNGMVSRVTPLRYDLAIVGAGIIGLALAALARERGMSVVVVERYDRAVGPSVRNFGHIGVTTQEDEALVHARAGREHWLRLAAQAGFWIPPARPPLLPRGEEEGAIIEEFAAQRDGSVRVLDARGVREI